MTSTLLELFYQLADTMSQNNYHEDQKFCSALPFFLSSV